MKKYPIHDTKKHVEMFNNFSTKADFEFSDADIREIHSRRLSREDCMKVGFMIALEWYESTIGKSESESIYYDCLND